MRSKVLSHSFVRDICPYLGLISGLFSIACTAPVDEAGPGEVRARIVNGEASDTIDDAVMRIDFKTEGALASACTATLVAPNLVFTALHCVSFFGQGEFSCDSNGMLSPNTPGDGEIGALVPAQDIRVYAGAATTTEPTAYGAKVFGTGSPNICRNDFAMVLLDRELDLPLATLRMARPMQRGELMTVVGYGLTETLMGSGRRRRTGVQVLDVGPLVAGTSGTTAPRTFVVSEGPCHGDSGGPAFADDTGALSGVYSLAGSRNCTARNVRNVYTRISPFSSLIEAAFAEAGYEPQVEFYDGPPEQIDDPSVEPTDPDDRFGGSGSRDDGCSVASRNAPSTFGWVALALTLAASVRRQRRPA